MPPFCSAALVLLLAATPQASPAAAARADVRWSDEALTVHVADAPRAVVLLEVARLAGIEIVGLERVDGTVTASFDHRPLEEGLKALLPGISFALIDGAGAGALPNARYTLRITDTDAHPGPHGAAARQPIVVPAIQQMHADLSDPPDPDEEAQAREDEQERSDDFADAEASGLFDPKAPLGPLVEAVEDSDNPLVKIRALQVLNERNPGKAVKPLIEALTDNDETVAQEAVTILGRRQDEVSRRQLEATVLKESDTSARLGSLQALALRADPASVPALKQAATDKDPLVREIAAQMLSEFAFRAKLGQR